MLINAVIVKEYDFAYAYCAATGCSMDEYYDNLLDVDLISDAGAMVKNQLGNVYCESFDDSSGETYMKVYPVKN